MGCSVRELTNDRLDEDACTHGFGMSCEKALFISGGWGVARGINSWGRGAFFFLAIVLDSPEKI